MLFQKPFTIKVKKGVFVYEWNHTCTDTILGKWAVILAADVYTVDCSGNHFLLFLGGYKSKRKEQEERAKARKNVFQNLDAAIAAAPICEHIPCRTNPAKFYFLGYRQELFQSRKMLVFSVPI